VLGSGHGVDAVQINKIEAILAPMFQALPRNRQGRVSAPVMRYMVQRYFSQRHGWIIRGFEPHAQAANISEVNGTDHVLQRKLPDYVRSALEEKFGHGGFALKDTAMMVAAVERLAFDEVVRGVETAFHLNLIPTTQVLSSSNLTEILGSFLIIEMLEGKIDNVEQHVADKANIYEIYPSWDEAFAFMQDMMKNDGFERMEQSNPFVNQEDFSFEDASRIAQRLSEDFGPASNHECGMIRDKLAAMDVHETGRVKLSAFYGKSQQGSWEFLESVEYLRTLGALDESSTLHGPQVIIPNYVSGLSNCITSAPYYSVCCVNDCDKVYQHLEKDINAPMAAASEILQSMDRMLIGSPNISTKVRAKLEEVAAHHDGKVPLHGRLFAQWLHYAFPRDCPYPHMAGTVKPETPLRYEDTGGEDSTVATGDEVEQWLKSESARIAPSPEAGSEMWSMHENLLESSTPSDNDESSLRKTMRSIAHLGMLGALVLMLKNMMPQVQSVLVPKVKSVEYDV